MPKRTVTLKIGLTGGIGSGKSAVLGVFSRAGAETVSLDRIAHDLLQKGRPVYRAVVRSFGTDILDKTGRIDRGRLGQRVFKDARLRRRLEALIHPAIRREMRRRVRASTGGLAVIDVPLLFEGRLQKYFDLTVLVTAPRSVRIERVRRRDHVSRAAVIRRMRAQLPEYAKRRLADVVLRNDGSLQALDRKVREYQTALQAISGGMS